MKTRELYSIEDARFLLGGIARKTIYDLLNYGELASVMIGRRRFIAAAAITTFIADRTTYAAPSEYPAKGRTRRASAEGCGTSPDRAATKTPPTSSTPARPPG